MAFLKIWHPQMSKAPPSEHKHDESGKHLWEQIHRRWQLILTDITEQEVFFILIRTTPFKEKRKRASSFYGWTGHISIQPSLIYLTFHPSTEIQRTLPKLAYLLSPKPHLCFSLYVHPNLGCPQSHPSLRSSWYLNSSMKLALLTLGRCNLFFLLWPPHRTLMRTVPGSPSDCITCKHIDFPKRDHARGVGDKVLSLHISQHSASQRRLV